MNDTSWKFYTNTEEAWQAMLLAIHEAKNSIDLEQFIFSNDEIGSKFIELIKMKADEGVKVRLLLDSAGSYGFYNSQIIEELKRANIEVSFYNPISPWRLHNITSWYWRNHRKLLIIDNEIAFTGGVGIEYVMKDWRDTEVRLTGQVVFEMSYIFNRMWQITSEGRFKRFRLDRWQENEFRFWTNSPHFRQRFYYRRLIKAIKRAKKYVYLTTPYFIPNQHLLFVLSRAAMNKVDVRLITPEHSDHHFVDHARNSYYTLALKAGVKIYHYKNQVLHAKTVVIDDNWSSVGSANLDNLSLLFNYEANLISTNQQFVGELKEHFVNDLLNSEELTKSSWSNRSTWYKFMELLTWPFHGLM